MKTRQLVPALFILLSTTSSSWAAATAEEAARILASFQTYIGTEPGVVAVTPAGDGYDISFDFTPYLKKIEQPGFLSAVDPFRFTATPAGDGTWAVASSGPYKAKAEAPGLFSFDMQVADMQWKGTYDENLFTFTENNYTISKLAMNQSNTDPSTQMLTSTVYTIDAITGSGTAKDVGNGLVDSDGVVTLSGLVSANKIQLPPELASQGMPDLSYTANIAKTEYTTRLAGLASRPMMDLLAWAFAHPSKELVLKDQAQLKEKLLAALPLFGSLQSDGKYENATVDTSYGQFAMGNGGFSVGMNGAVKDGRFAESFEMDGFKMPDNLLPPWTAGLIPKKVKLGFDVSDFDLETPTKKFITEMDIAADEPVPPGSEEAYMAAFAPKNSILLGIPSGEISSELYSITYEGSSTINFAGLPVVNAKVRMTGMDAVIAKLQQEAADPTAQQGMAMLFAAKGISKADGDGVVWDITMSPEGKMLVNGTDMSAMMGAVAPPPAQ